MFRGREQAHPERGRMLLERLFEDISELAVIEQHPLQEGRNMHMMLAPTRAALADLAEPAAAETSADALPEAPEPEPADAAKAEAFESDPESVKAETPADEAATA